MVDDAGTVVLVVDVLVDVVESVGADGAGAGIVAGVGGPPVPAGVDAAGAGRTNRYSTSVHANATMSAAVDRRTGSRISGVPRRVCSPRRAS